MILFRRPALLVAPVLVLIALVLAPGSPLEGQGAGFLVGTVLDERSKDPLKGATVSIVGTEFEVVTDEEGWFELVGLPIGAVTMRTSMPGYASVVEPLVVSAPELGFLQVWLRPVDAILDELLVSVGRAPPRNSGLVGRETRPQESWRSALDLIEQEVPGVEVRRAGSNVGTGASISIRGVGSFENNAPVIYVDGIRIDDSAGTLRAMHALDLIPADMVARVRVLRGPSAAAAYAFGANGVILIETRRGGR